MQKADRWVRVATLPDLFHFMAGGSLHGSPPPPPAKGEGEGIFFGWAHLTPFDTRNAEAQECLPATLSAHEVPE